MKKVMVIGPSGAGKSTFARKLSEILGLPLYPLDRLFWKEDKTHISKEEFDVKLEEILRLDSFIIDGDYARTYQRRMENCDTIFFLDFSLQTCLEGVFSRTGKRRDDFPWVEESINPEFENWIRAWFLTKRPSLLLLLDKYKRKKQIIVFHERKEIEAFLESL